MELPNNRNGRGRRAPSVDEEYGMVGNRRSRRRGDRNRSHVRNANGSTSRSVSRPRGRRARVDELVMRHNRHRSRSSIRGDLPVVMRENMSILQSYLSECEHNLVECELQRGQVAQMVNRVLDYRQRRRRVQPGVNIEEHSPTLYGLRLPDPRRGYAERLDGDSGGNSSPTRSGDFLPLSLGPGRNQPQQTTVLAEGAQLNLGDMPLSTTPPEIDAFDMAAGDDLHELQRRSSSLTHSAENISGVPGNKQGDQE